MLKDKLLKRIFIIAVLIYIFFIVIFDIVAIWNNSLLLGWITGGSSAILGFIFGTLLMMKINLKKVKSKIFLQVFGKIILQFLWQVIIFMSVIMINNVANENGVFEGGMDDMLSPINLITYLCGVIIITMSTFIAHVPMFKKKEVANERI